MATVPPPPQDVPTAKEKKYDRQLRLWGGHGQEALESAHVLVFNSGSGVAVIEALKNIVLPGKETLHLPYHLKTSSYLL